MLKYVNHDIVFQEFPDEVTLAINLSCCPNGCTGCHSAYLRGDVGEELTLQRLEALIESYAGEITCVALMGATTIRKPWHRTCSMCADTSTAATKRAGTRDARSCPNLLCCNRPLIM